MSLMLVFPGQGSQYPGMLQALPDHPAVQATLNEAANTLQTELSQLDTASALHATREVQLCLCITGVACARLLIHEGLAPAMVAGFSIGAWPAAVVAGVLDFAQALRLVALRGELMQHAFPAHYGMLAVVGLRQNQLEPLIARLHSQSSPLYLANFNSEQQFVLAGHDSALQAFTQLAPAAGAQACHRLAMSVPSHCPLLLPAAQQLQQALAQAPLHAPRYPYLSSNQARVLFKPQAIATDLAMNMAQPVRWADSIEHAWERGMRTVLEVPPGQVLSGLNRQAFSQGQVLAWDGQAWERLLSDLTMTLK